MLWAVIALLLTAGRKKQKPGLFKKSGLSLLRKQWMRD
jgi:hypothetical protein